MDGALLCKVSRRDLNRYSRIDSDPLWALNSQQAVHPWLSPKKAWSAACRLGDSEAVFQHLKADNFTIGNAEHHREVRLDDLAGWLEL